MHANNKTVSNGASNACRTKGLFDVFEGHDRFGYPAGIVRVTGGYGGEATLIFGSEKTALLDCGMAYCGEVTVCNIRAALAEAGRENLDYVLLSHTHYDHIGALPFIRRQWPEVVTYGAAHGKEILERPGAIRKMKELGDAAAGLYRNSTGFADHEECMRDETPTEGLSVDKVLTEGDRLSLGDSEIITLETKGHTDCSLSFVLKPQSVLFASESTGVLAKKDFVHSPILKSYAEAMDSARKLQAYGAKQIVIPHFGLLPEYFNERYWELFISCSEEKIDLIKKWHSEDPSDEAMLKKYVEYFWTPDLEQEHPMEAFAINSRNIIRVYKEHIGIGSQHE